MRNLKKLLALTLALAMAFSLMLGASAADVKFEDYPDKDSITAEFTEGVQVLTGLKVFQGDEKGFRPGDKITRAEAAAVIYRAVTGDVTNRQNDLYKDYGTFTDVNSDDWFAGYVGYCQNAGYIKGTTPTTFNPYGQVTGYEVLAMILRAVGYGKGNEFVGSQWQVNVAALSRQLGVTRNVTAAHMEQTLNMAAPREVVADLVFMTIATVPTVTYTPALAYNDKQSVAGADSNIFNVTLGQQVFGLYHDITWQVIDAWGNPGYRWYNNGAWNGSAVTTVSGGKGYMIPANHPWYTSTRDSAPVATIKQAPDYQTTEQVHECDVADAVDFDVEENFRLYVNQKTPLTDDYRVVATDTVTKVGGQGRLTKVYYEMVNPWFTDTADNHDKVVTMVDTMLARVTAKTDAKLDPAGHVITPAKLEVTIYDGESKTNVTSVAANAQSTRIISKKSDDAANWDEYAAGDYILINAYTDKDHNADTTGVTGVKDTVWDALGNNIVRGDQAALEKAAFETNKVVIAAAGQPTYTLVQGINAWVLQKSESKQGKQTVTYWNQGKHQVDGTDYNDQICLFLDRAGSVTNTTFTWFFDQYENLIGIGDAKATNYGVITSVYAAFVQGDSQTDGKVKAMATVRYTDGTTGTVEVDRFLMSQGSNVPDVGTTNGQDYGANPNTALQMNGTVDVNGAPVAVTAANTICLWPVYDNAAHSAMSVGPAAVNPAPTSAEAANVGWLYMAPSAVTNTNAHFGSNIGTENYFADAFGILFDHMFEFTTASDDTVVAIEVAGHTLDTNGVNLAANTSGTAAENATNMNNGLYVNNFNGAANATNGKLFKSLGFLTLNNSTPDSAAANVWLDNDTEIIIRSGNYSRGLSVYTLDTLPGDVTLDNGAEVDWADVDGDGRADYLYIAGNVPGVITYGLFYYNGGAARWDAASSTGTIEGYLNGEAETITTTNRTVFNTIQGSNGYSAHLFALQMRNDVVASVMEADNERGSIWGQYILAEYTAADAWRNTTDTVLKFGSTGVADANGKVNQIRTGSEYFGVGAAHGNSYTAVTEAVYYNTGDATTNMRYERASLGNRIVVYSGTTDGDVYYIAPTAKIIGELEWLNSRVCDVTIVYENGAALSATQVYITPDPDVTPDEPSNIRTFTAGVQTLDTTGMTDAGLLSVLQGMGPNRVVYAPRLKAVPADLASAANLLYFPYTAASGTTVSLTITNSSNTVVYFETGTASASGSGQCARIDMSGAHVAAGATIAQNLTSGTYTYRIVNTTTGAPLSSGTFTIG